MVLETILVKAIEFYVEKTLNKSHDLFDKLNSQKSNLFNKNELPEIFSSHYTEAINWSSDIPFIGLNKKKLVANSTIELSISTKLSKYDQTGVSTDFFSELEILNNDSNVLILGKPGAGKTTTIKRLIGLFFSENNHKINYTNPILLRLRELNDSSTIFTAIMDIFGFPWETREIKTTKKVVSKNGDFFDRETSIFKTFLKNTDTPIEQFVSSFLNETNAILFLDGYDELQFALQNSILVEVEKLGLKLNNSKIIITSRTSSFNKIISNFNIFEINVLSLNDIEQIANKWLNNGSDFISELISKKYLDLANRPIYLTLLLIIFEKNKSLPLSPFEVYGQAVYLIISDWDEHRGINRLSKYAHFDVRKKLDFLQEVSYHLTYKIKNTSFSSEQLSTVYKQIHKKYDLPLDDMTKVVHEIESHNGLISEVSNDNFEFSHLSLQEYLCAQCLITLPFTQNTIKYFIERPDPLAIAVCISRDSGQWLTNLLLNKNHNIKFFDTKSTFESAMIKFLSRLLEEKPRFNDSIDLGVCMVYLIANFHHSSVAFDLIKKICLLNNVIDSLKLALVYYDSRIDKVQLKCFLTRDKVIQNDNFIDIPLKESIKLDKWNEIQEILNR